ncbi:acyltransferase family protein [Eleftheria terrae]|uniref:acyltransferase family protein n=1 Tax=Eleftheria terrae TaxID=1597781 RepID=UPI00263A429E|nr:acyltransferase [Eleftheria terrae]WKB55621.1 acyltransferase [Eleftheria terrae]
MPSRHPGLDLARGLLMFYIVAVVHAVFWLQLLPQSFSSWWLFEMPGIFVVSGYAYSLYERAQAGGRPGGPQGSGYLAYLAGRGVRVLLPYLVYATACALLWHQLQQRHDAAGAPAVSATLLAWLNPLRHGEGHTLGVLNGQLWFLTPFLLVTALLPVVTRLKLPWRPPLWVCMLLLAGLLFLLGQGDIKGGYQLRTTLFYLAWAVLGYALDGRLALQPRELAATGGLAMLCVAGLHALLQAPLDMQDNKFPPNAVFVFFTSAWMCLLLPLARRMPSSMLARLEAAAWLRPFVRNGYSLYLWQGMGYTAAMAVAARLHLPWPATWALAVLSTVALGLLFAPVERVRLRGFGRRREPAV